jgi:hypothetical protein
LEGAILLAFFLILALIAGIIGTGGMTLFMHLVTRSGIANADMVRAIGSFFTRSLESAFSVGLILHFLVGIIFAIFYFLFFSFAGVSGFPNSGIAGLIFGFIHGFKMSFLLVITVSERHPMGEFRTAGISVAIAHIIGHLIYGLLVGIVFGLARIDLGSICKLMPN